MYLREVRRRNKDGSEVVYYQLAESLYDKLKRQARVRVVHTFGRADEVDPEALRRLSASLLKVCGAARPPELESDRTYDLGLIHVVGSLWERLGVGPALRHYMAREGQGHPFDRILMALAAYRLDDPLSELGCYEYWLPKRVWLPESRAWKLEEFYRAMDFYLDHANALEEELLRTHGALFGAGVELVFVDVSLLAIETGEGAEIEPSFASVHQREAPGHAKLWVGLAISREGVPLRSWTLPEGTPQAVVMARILEDLDRWGLNRIVFIGEAGVFAAKQGGFSRIQAVSMHGVKDVVLARPGRYRPMAENLEVKEVVVNAGGRRNRYVLCRNPEEARRKAEWRAWVLQLLEAELQALDPAEGSYAERVQELRTSRLFGRYVKESRAKRLLMDPVKVSREARMDGKCVLTTNDDALTAEEVALSDQGARVAEAFFGRVRSMGLRARPSFHWSPRRIEAHVRLCAMVLLVQRYAEVHAGASWEHLRRLLESCKAVHFRIGGTDSVQQTRMGTELQEVLVRLGVPPKAPLEG